LSAATCALLFFGSSARVFTSIQETGDSAIIITYLLATMGNFIIVAQLIYYNYIKKTTPSKSQKKKKQK
jgi:mannose-P-dolichol utilization defect protein 1